MGWDLLPVPHTTHMQRRPAIITARPAGVTSQLGL